MFHDTPSDDETFYQPSYEFSEGSSHCRSLPIESHCTQPSLCRFFALNRCRYGDLCTFSHSLPQISSFPIETTTDPARFVDCPFYLRGNCKFGDRCRHRHTHPPAMDFISVSVPVLFSPHTSFTCGICLDDIVENGKRFGLLTGCDHCYCMDCLRKWRTSRDLVVDVTRACPECRKPSYFIVSSITFLKGHEKEMFINRYKTHLSQRKCKYFNGTLGSCPFGRNCFYAHRNKSGRDVKEMDHRKRNIKKTNAFELSFPGLWSSYSQLLTFFRSFGWQEMDDDFLFEIELDNE